MFRTYDRQTTAFPPSSQLALRSSSLGEKRIIFHLDMDAFFVSVEQVLDPSLKGKPCVVGGSPTGRGVIAAASYEARRYGVHSAMPAAHAKRLCPHLVFIRGHHQYYQRASDKVREILHHYSPDVEPASIDEFYIDFTGSERLYGQSVELAERIRREIRERLRLPASIGIGANKLMSKIGSKHAKPDGFCHIPAGTEEEFLAPLPVQTIPGVGESLLRRLLLFRIETIGQLALLKEEELQRMFGKLGVALYYRARGCDTRLVQPKEGVKSMSNETTFDQDILDPAQLKDILRQLVNKIGRRLRKRSLQASTVSLKLRYSDFRTYTRSRTLLRPTCFDHVIFEAASEMLERLFTRRVRTRLIGIGLNNLSYNPWQLDLFDVENNRWRSYYDCLDEIRARYGSKAVSMASDMVVEDR